MAEFRAVEKKGVRKALKDMKLLVWVTQLGLSVAVPLGGFLLLAIWLQNKFSLGVWVIIVGLIVGAICAAEGLISSLKAMKRMSKKEEEETPPVSFNEHE